MAFRVTGAFMGLVPFAVTDYNQKNQQWQQFKRQLNYNQQIEVIRIIPGLMRTAIILKFNIIRNKSWIINMNINKVRTILLPICITMITIHEKMDGILNTIVEKRSKQEENKPKHMCAAQKRWTLCNLWYNRTTLTNMYKFLYSYTILMTIVKAIF